MVSIKRKGFTLVESMVVLVIFGIIMLATYSFSSTQLNTLISYNDLHNENMKAFNELNAVSNGAELEGVTKDIETDYRNGVLYRYEKGGYKVYVYEKK